MGTSIFKNEITLFLIFKFFFVDLSIIEANPTNLALAFFIAGQQDTAVYDGSWTEWGSQKDSLIVNDEI